MGRSPRTASRPLVPKWLLPSQSFQSMPPLPPLVCSIDESIQLESVVASPDLKIYFYGPSSASVSGFNEDCFKKLDKIKVQCVSAAREKFADLKVLQKKMRLLFRAHDSLVFCLEQIGLSGTIYAAHTLLSELSGLVEIDVDNGRDNGLAGMYLENVIKSLNYGLVHDVSDSSMFQLPFDADLVDGVACDSFALGPIEEPWFSKKLSLLIEILYKYRKDTNIKCIIFVKRIIVARSLAYVLQNVKGLEFFKCEFLVGFHSGSASRRAMNTIVENFCNGKLNLLVATNVAEEGLDIQTCCLVVRFDPPETVASFIQSRGRARMLKSEYIFLAEGENEREKKLLDDFISSEKNMNKEVTYRTSNDTYDSLEETTYRVNETGALISTGCSISLLHHYCSKLPHDQYFIPVPKFFFKDDTNGSICTILLPSNCPIRQVESEALPSKDDAKRAACLRACKELHSQGALTEYLLPVSNKKCLSEAMHSVNDGNEDPSLREELHETYIPTSLRTWETNSEDEICLHFYYINFIPVPRDREYRRFGLFVACPLPEEAKALEIDLHLAHGRIVKTGLVPSGVSVFDREEINHAQKFQEMSLGIILDRSKFFSDFVALGKIDVCEESLSTYYLLLPVIQDGHSDSMVVDWETIKCCLSSPIFEQPSCTDGRGCPKETSSEMLELANGPVETKVIINSLVFTAHNKLFFFVDGILSKTNAYSLMKGSTSSTYLSHYQNKFNINLSNPEEPFLKAKQLFQARNLLHNRVQDNTESRELEEHFVELPPEVCCLKIIGFSKDIGSSLSLLFSFMHRLENLLVAIQLKDVFIAAFPEGVEVSACRVLEALTTEKCLERFSLERLEVLGDAFLKYVVGRYCFISCDALDEGQLTLKRSCIVNNSNLYELALKKNLQVYIRDESFDPSHFFAFGRPCTIVCNKDTACMHNHGVGAAGTSKPKCNKFHRWLHRKTIADVMEALTGAFLVDSGFQGASAFLQWVGIQVNYSILDVHKICRESTSNMSLIDDGEIASLEKMLGHHFHHRGLLVQALIHPSFSRHSGGCYQRLEFLGDAVLEYLITSYLFSVYPDLKPGQLTDMKSIIVNNISFAHLAVSLSLHEYLIKDSNSLTEALNKFEAYVSAPESARDLMEEPSCPKVLGDLVESCIGALLLDSCFDLNLVWRAVLVLLDPVLRLSSFQLSPIRELRELCQSHNFVLSFPDPLKKNGTYEVKVIVTTKEGHWSCTATNHSSKTARRIAALEAISKLKVLGFKSKRKTLEEIVVSTRREKPKLVGFDEKPVIGDVSENILGEKDECEAEVATIRRTITEEKFSSTPFLDKASINDRSNSGRVLHRLPSIAGGPVHEHQSKTSNSVCESKQQLTGLVPKSAKSKLFEICAANYWEPPSFFCCKEEGECHLKLFTYKVTLTIETGSSTTFECFSEPKPKKKAAKEHAAEGTLWYLKHMGYLS